VTMSSTSILATWKVNRPLSAWSRPLNVRVVLKRNDSFWPVDDPRHGIRRGRPARTRLNSESICVNEDLWASLTSAGFHLTRQS
jgi:hypothetical protein